MKVKLPSLSRCLAGLCLLVLAGGCASTPERNTNRIAENELRNQDLDVLFATEFPVASAEEALGVAANAMNAGDVDKALFYFVRALQFNPDNVELLAHIGEIHMRRNNQVMAQRAFLRATALDPEYAPALEALGLIHMTEGKDDEAVAELRQAVALDDGRWRAHNALGVFADKRAEYEAARSHYNAALTHNPGAGHVLNNRGYSRYLAGDPDGAAIDLYEAANARGFRLAWGNLALVYASRGWYEDAVSTYLEVTSDANAYNKTGEMALRNGDFDEARRLLTEAINRSPTYFPEAEENLRLLQKIERTPVLQTVTGAR